MYVYTCMYVNVCMYACVCMYVCVYVNACMYVCVYVCMHLRGVSVCTYMLYVGVKERTSIIKHYV